MKIYNLPYLHHVWLTILHWLEMVVYIDGELHTQRIVEHFIVFVVCLTETLFGGTVNIL